MTTNEMIYKTINTKLTKNPVYKSVLEDLGYEVYDSDWSAYKNWAVRNKTTGKMVVLSKGYNGKKGLYDVVKPIKYTDIKKVDYVRYLKSTKVSYGYNQTYCGVDNIYKKLRRDIKDNKIMIRRHKMSIKSIERNIKKLSDTLNWYNEELSDCQNKLDNARNKVVELKGEV